MNWRIVIGDWESCREEAQRLRIEVFVIEQGVPIELEWDESDAVSLHALVFDVNNHAVATGRLLPDGHLGRFAVEKSFRKRGIGRFLLTSLIDEAIKLDHTELVLHAQVSAEKFYAQHGFASQGAEFMEAGIPHKLMRLQLAS